MLLHCLLVCVVSDTFRCSLYLVPFYVNVFFSLLRRDFLVIFGVEHFEFECRGWFLGFFKHIYLLWCGLSFWNLWFGICGYLQFCQQFQLRLPQISKGAGSISPRRCPSLLIVEANWLPYCNLRFLRMHLKSHELAVYRALGFVVRRGATVFLVLRTPRRTDKSPNS